VAGGDEDREAYKSGLLVLGCILASIYTIWWMVLVVLKCKGASVGCASGRSFLLEKTERSVREDGSTDLEDDTEDASGVSRFADELSFHSSIQSSEVEGDSIGSEEYSEYSIISRPTARERRTQLAFVGFGLATLAMVPFVLTLSFSPLKDVVSASETYVLESRAVISQIDNALKTVDVVVKAAETTVAAVPTEFSEVCPLKTAEEISSDYNIDLAFLVSVVKDEFDSFRDTIDRSLSDVISNTNDFDRILVKVETAHDQSETYLWAIPSLMIGLTCVTAALILGVVLAWFRRSNKAMQDFLSYGALPCLILLSFTCWMIGIFSALSTAIFSDACAQGSTSGNPVVELERILSLEGYGANSTAFDIAKAYTGGCAMKTNPTALVDALADEMQVLIDDVWSYIASVDSIGKDTLIAVCGSDALNDLLGEAQDVARLLTSVRRALDVVSSSLECEEISPIYFGVVEDATCSDLAESSGWAMILFLLLGVSTMCMISLRASWRNKLGEEQIYNEDEVAENMFVGEHEEYLYYISKYKHEWDEYGGINTAVPPITPNAQRNMMYEEGSESEDSTGSRTNSEEGENDELGEDEEEDDEQLKYIAPYDKQAEPFNPYQTKAPQALSTVGSECTEDISFLSLQSLQKTPQGESEDEEIDSNQMSTNQASSALGSLRNVAGQYTHLFRTATGGDRSGTPTSTSEVVDSDDADGVVSALKKDGEDYPTST
jgi:hypothetical protein